MCVFNVENLVSRNSKVGRLATSHTWLWMVHDLVIDKISIKVVKVLSGQGGERQGRLGSLKIQGR